MRQKTINFIFDKVMWYVLYFLPILILLIQSINNSVLSLDTVITSLGLAPISTNIIYTTLTSIFGNSGTFPLFVGTAVFEYLAYFISMYLLHFVVDISLFIIKLTRKWLDSVVGGVE